MASVTDGGSDAPVGVDGDAAAIEGPEALLVLVESRQQGVRAESRSNPMLRRQGPGVARELFDAEQLGPQGRLARTRTRTRLRSPPDLPA